MEAKRSLDHGARRESESPVPAPPSPPAYSSSFSEPQTSPSSHERRRKRRSRSRSSSARSKRSRSKERSRKHSRRDRSRSRGRSRSKERRRSRSRNKSRDRHRHREGRRHHRQPSYESDLPHEDPTDLAPVAMPFALQPNAFKNDGSFMEMFKKMQGAQTQNPDAATSSTNSTAQAHILQEKTAAPPPLMVGKRRGGRILKTGMVAKPKTEVTEDQPKDAWSIYMAEVKKYREVCCQEEDNTRPLVK